MDKIVSKISNDLRYILWKNYLDTIEWFKNITHKNKTTFIQFDIIDFYPSKMKELLLQSINLARNYTDITEEELDIILAYRKSVLVYNNTTWEKKATDNFDITMGSSDFALIADLVGIYILDTLGRFLDLSNIRIYRDDGLISIPNRNDSLTSKIQKKVIRAFEYMGLKTEISSNLKIINF